MNISAKVYNLLSKVKFIALDFDGVFTDNRVYTTEAGEESVACWRSDGLGLAKIKNLNIPIWVISTEKNQVVSKRCEKLGIDCMQGCDDKLAALTELLEKNKCDFRDAVFVGNDINDAECLERVGLPIIVADAHPDVDHLALYKTEMPGGKGAVREVCDLIAKHHIMNQGA